MSLNFTAIRAPFTETQVKKINEVQTYGKLHPYTCDGCEISRILHANKDGLFCSFCGYKQSYVYSMTFEEHGRLKLKE